MILSVVFFHRRMSVDRMTAADDKVLRRYGSSTVAKIAADLNPSVDGSTGSTSPVAGGG